jgi:hypothetical protein
MEMHQPTRIQLLVRRNKGRTEHLYYVAELSHLLGTPIEPNDILDLEETDRLLSIHREHAIRGNKELNFVFRRKWNFLPTRRWSGACSRVASVLIGQPAVLFVGPYEFCGAVKVDADRALSEVAALLDFDKNTVSLQSFAPESGLYLDLFEEHSQWFVELVIWGQWKALAENTLLSEGR